MLANTCGDDRLRPCNKAEPLDDELRRQRAVGRVVVTERVGRLHVREQIHPLGIVADTAGLVLCLQRDDEIGDDLFSVTNNRHVSDTVLRDFGRIDIGVNDASLGRERIKLARHAIVKTRTERDEQIALLQGADGRN